MQLYVLTFLTGLKQRGLHGVEFVVVQVPFLAVDVRVGVRDKDFESLFDRFLWW